MNCLKGLYFSSNLFQVEMDSCFKIGDHIIARVVSYLICAYKYVIYALQIITCLILFM